MSARLRAIRAPVFQVLRRLCCPRPLSHSRSHLGLALQAAHGHCVGMSVHLSRAQLRAVASLAAVVAITLLVRWWPFVATGTVRLESFDGSISAPHSASVCAVSRRQLLAHVRKEFDQLPLKVAAADQAIAEAREEWNRRARRRDDAGRVLRVAERSNASDLSACRAVYERAASETDTAYESMEARMRERDALEDPATIIGSSPDTSSAKAANSDGSFVLRSWGPRSAFFVLVRAEDQKGASMLWLVPANHAPAIYDNSNMLTPAALRTLAGLK